MERIREHKEALEKLCRLITREQECAKIIAPSNKTYVDDLEKAKKEVDDEFTVLIMGIFSSGKSSMINALIGESLLPTGFLPETAVIGEMHYSQERKITMYPKPGMWEGGDQPFDLENPTTEELAKYASIDNEAGINNMKEGSGRVIEAKFEKMVIHWPLEILKDNIVLIDSPGINDPWSNDHIAKAYIPKVDAVIYLMSSQQAYQKEDAKQLEEINSIGNRNIVIGYTFFDQILTGTPQSVSKVKTILSAHAGRHSDLGPEAIHYLSSLDGLKAKMTHDKQRYIDSGYDGLEKYLAKYLVEGKGVSQVKLMMNKIKHYADRLKQEAQTRNGATTMDDLNERIRLAKDQMTIIKRETDSLARQFELDIKECREDAYSMIEKFVPTLAENIDLEGFEPETSLPAGLGKLNPIANQKKAKAIQEECVNEYNHRLNLEQMNWSQSKLAPFLEEKVPAAVEKIQPGLIELAQKLNNVDVILSEGTVRGNSTAGVVSLALAAGYGLLTGDWYTSAMGAIYGKGILAKRLAVQAGVGLATGALISAGVVISVPVFIGAVIVADLVMILSANQGKKTAQILKTVVKNSRKGYSEDTEGQEKTIAALKENVDAYLERTVAQIKDALNADISQKEALIAATVEEAQKEKGEREKAIAARNKAVEDLNQLLKEADTLAKGYSGINV